MKWPYPALMAAVPQGLCNAAALGMDRGLFQADGYAMNAWEEPTLDFPVSAEQDGWKKVIEKLKQMERRQEELRAWCNDHHDLHISRFR